MDAHDAASASTVLSVLTGLFDELGGRIEALAWHDHWADAIAAVGRRGDDDRCPACRAEAPSTPPAAPASTPTASPSTPVATIPQQPRRQRGRRFELE